MHFRKWIALLTAAATMTMGMPAFAVQAGDADDWQTKYIKQLKADCPEPEDGEETTFRYSLVDLFGDEHPELILSQGDFHTASTVVYTMWNGEMIQVGTFGEYGLFCYDTTGGEIVSAYMQMGHSGHTRCRFNSGTGKCEVTFQCEDNEGTSDDESTYYYKVNGKEVTKDEYTAALAVYNDHDSVTYGRDYLPDNTDPIRNYTLPADNAYGEAEGPDKEVDWKQLYISQLGADCPPPGEELDELSIPMYSLADLFGDEIPELIISNGEYHVATVGIYTIRGGEAWYLGEFGEWGKVGFDTTTREIIDSYTGMGITETARYSYNLKTGRCDLMFSCMDDSGAAEDPAAATYKINGEEVSADAYAKALKAYEGHTVQSIGRDNEATNTAPITDYLLPSESESVTDPTEPVTDPTEPVTDPTEPATDSTENVTISITALDTSGLVTYTGEPVTKTAPLVNVSGAVVKEAAFEVLDAKSYPFSVKVGSEIEVKEYRDADAGLDPNSHGGEYPVYYTVYAPVTITLTDENTPSGSYSMRLRCTKLVDENGNNLLLNYKDGDLISKWDLTLNNETERTGPEILYKDVLDFFRKNISEGWANFEDEDIFYGVDNSGGSSAVSYMWKRYLTENTLDEVGYDFIDVNNDGVPELLIGLLGQGMESGIGDNCSTIMDAYTYYNGKVVHLCSGGERVDIGIRLNGFVESGSAGAASYVTTQYALRNGALVPTECWKTDFDNKEMPNAYSKTPVLREENGYSYYEFTDWKAFDDSATVVTAEPFTIVTFGSQSAPEPADPEVMYKDILDMFRKNISENWANYEGGTEYGLIMEEKEPTVSYMWLRYNMTLGLEETGYLFLDIDEDGTPELLVGTPRESKAGSDLTWVGDIYTYYNGKAVHLASSGERDLFSIGKKEIIEMGSGSAASSITAFYHVSEGGLVPYEAYSYDAATYPKNPYLHSTTPKIITADGMSYYDFEWEQITEAAYNEGSEIHPIVYFPAILFAEPAGTLGDVDGSGSINASDAAKVLIAAASIGGGKDSGLTKAQETAADVNSDGSINATDAALILQYAAYVGGNGTDTFPEFLKNRDNNQQ